MFYASFCLPLIFPHFLLFFSRSSFGLFPLFDMGDFCLVGFGFCSPVFLLYPHLDLFICIHVHIIGLTFTDEVQHACFVCFYFWVCLILLNIVLSRSIHFQEHFMISCIEEYHFYMYHIFIIHSFIDGHLGWCSDFCFCQDLCVCIFWLHISPCTMCMGCLRKQRKGIEYSETRVKDVCKLL